MKQKKTLSILLVLTLLITCAPWTAAAAASTEESVGTEAIAPTTEQPVVEETQLPLLEADTVPETMEYADAVAQNHILRLYGEEGNDLNRVVFLNRDGSRTMYLYDYPVKYVDSNGSIRDISLDIADSNTPLSKYETAANSTVTSFSEKLSDGISLTGNGVSIRLVPVQPALQPGQSLTATAEAVAQRLDSKTVEYRYDAKTTIEYSLTYTGFKEDIVVSEYTGQTEYHFFLYTGGLSLTQIDGSYFLTDEDGTIKSSIGEIIVFTADERNNTFGQLEAVTIKDKQIYLLTIVLDAEYLSDPNTTYPIRIDPTVQINYGSSGTDAIEDVTIYSNGQSDHTAEILHIGLRPTEGIARVLMKFPGLDLEDLGQGLEIVNATVQLHEVVLSDIPLTVYCHIFRGAEWDAETIHGPDIHPRMVGAYLDSLTMSYSNGLGLSTPHCYSFDITAAVQGWVDGTYVQERGILFKASAVIESGDNEIYKIVGSYNRSSCRPALSITYNAQSGGSAVPEFSLDKTVVDIGENSSFNLNVTNPSELTVSWSSSNEAVATVSNGTVTTLAAGTAVITATVTDEHGNSNEAHCIVYVIIEDGVYYFRNNATGLYMGVANAESNYSHDVTQQALKHSGREYLAQFWKIKYVSEGYYTITPMHMLSRYLACFSGDVAISTFSDFELTTGTGYFAKWSIQSGSEGFIIRSARHSEEALMPQGLSYYTDISLVSGSYTEIMPIHQWDLELVTGVFLYNPSTNLGIPPDSTIYVELELSRYIPGVIISGADSQIYHWKDIDSDVVSVDMNTNRIYGLKRGETTLTLVWNINGVPVDTHLTLQVRETIYVKNYYDSTIDDETLGYIDDAIEFVNKAFNEQFYLYFVMDGDPMRYENAAVDICPHGAESYCKFSFLHGSCGNSCAEHHKNVHRIANEMYEDCWERNHVVVMWSNCPPHVYCSDDYHFESLALTTLIDVNGEKVPQPVIQILTINRYNKDDYAQTPSDKALMSLVLAHEIAHTLGLMEIYEDYYKDNQMHKDEYDEKFMCIMRRVNFNAADDFYNWVLSDDVEALCSYCIEKIKSEMPDNTYES